jgi:sugar lactone lactonase YvrE
MTATPRRLDAEIVLDAHAELGEGPAWEAANRKLIWVDIKASRVHRFDPATGEDQTLDVGQHVGAAVPRAAGGLLLALRDGFARFAGGSVSSIAKVEAERPENRMNDGKCDPRGRFWAGTMADDERAGAGTLYRLDEGGVTPMVTGVTISNGLAWSADERTMYYIDTPTGGVDAFDYDADSGSISGRRRVVTLPEGNGTPDGMTLDDDGCLWVALWGGWGVHRYLPDGTLDMVIPLPVKQVTSCAFGGEGADELYITSAAIGLSAEERDAQPHAGALFRCRPGVTGPFPTLAAL